MGYCVNRVLKVQIILFSVIVKVFGIYRAGLGMGKVIFYEQRYLRGVLFFRVIVGFFIGSVLLFFVYIYMIIFIFFCVVLLYLLKSFCKRVMQMSFLIFFEVEGEREIRVGVYVVGEILIRGNRELGREGMCFLF